MIRARSLTVRLVAVTLLLLLAFGVLVALLSREVVRDYRDESLQRLSRGLAANIVEHWPQIVAGDRDPRNRPARRKIIEMLQTVNPGVQVYLLDADGHVDDYLGQPGMVRNFQVDVRPIHEFLADYPLPIRSTDPMGGSSTGLFSAAQFPIRPGDERSPGYLFIVIDGGASGVAALSDTPLWRGAALAGVAGLLAATILGGLAAEGLTVPLNRLAERMRVFDRSGDDAESHSRSALLNDEVADLELAFAAMTARIAAQASREKAQEGDHREAMASVAHDLRTPLTALHGHLEMLVAQAAIPEPRAAPLLVAALTQSDRVRRLSQQLFELAALQSSEQPFHSERFQLDEVVSDCVGKFELTAVRAPVLLAGPPPGPLEIVGDPQLIERALTNLIDNALHHAVSESPVRVSLAPDGEAAHIVVEDHGPGLPGELLRRLELGQPVRDPPIRRAGGGIGGLGLAIAQRVTQLHGGTLKALPTPDGGTRLCMTLPLDAANRSSAPRARWTGMAVS